MTFKKEECVFECKQCGICCFGYGGTQISEEDIKKICKFLNIERQEFIKKYCVHSGSCYLIAQRKDGFCVFFDDATKLCKIHSVKPKMCKAWPFIEALLKDFDNWEIMAGSCKGINKDADKEKVLSKVNKNV